MQPDTENHIGTKLYTSENKDWEKREKLKFPCKLCMGEYLTHHFPHVEEASQLLEDSVISY